MEDAEIRQLFQMQKQSGERSWRCPDEVQLGAYIAKRLDASTRTAFEVHVADCDFCLSQLAFLAQAPDLDVERVPASLLSPARELVKTKQFGSLAWGWRWVAAPVAIAGLVLLVIGLGIQLRRQETIAPQNGPLVAEKIEPSPIVSPPLASAPPAAPSKAASPTPLPRRNDVRAQTANEFAPALVFPHEGQAIQRENLEFRWQPVADALSYEIRVMSAAGDVVFATQTESTRMKPDANVSLAPGTKYFVVVTARLREGKSVKSGVVSFRLTTR